MGDEAKETEPVLKPEDKKEEEDVGKAGGASEGRAPAAAVDAVESQPEDKATGNASSDQGGLNFRLCCAIACAAFGSAFQHGYNTGVVNAPQALIEAWMRDCPGNGSEPELNSTVVSDGASSNASECAMTGSEANLVYAWIVSIFCIGGMIGGSACGVISTRLGRKGGLLLNNILVVLAVIFEFCAKYAGSYHMIILGRLFIGINSGINAGISPMYLSEVSPVSLRGAVGTVYQLIITISILLSQIFGLESILGNDQGWPFLLGLTLIPAIIQVVTLPFCPESPKYLLLDRDDEARATSALTWLRGRVDVHDEMDEMRSEQEAMKAVPKVTFKEMICNSALRQPLTIAMMMMLAQQLSGINAAMFYSTSIFLGAGLTVHEAQVATLLMGTVNVAMTFVSLVLIEKAGRKTLMIVGLSIMFVTTILLLICLVCKDSVPFLSYVSVAMVIGFVIGFATGPGSIPWFFVTELFSQGGRPMATSIAVVTNWSANFLVGLGFSPFHLMIGPYVFIFFIVIQLLFVFYVKVFVPETKNKTIEEITAQFRNN